MHATLKNLIMAHSTPGDENAVALILQQHWKQSGWIVSSLGNYAITARKPGKNRRRLLICAHMDSPGFIVDRPGWSDSASPDSRQINVVPLGTPSFETESAEAQLKCRNGIFNGKIVQTTPENQDTPDYYFEISAASAATADLCIGDRLCFTPAATCADDLICAPFLDNRLGCWMLTRLAELKPGWNQRYEVVLGATGAEELTGFGAQALAAQVQADLVIVLDTTYEAREQGVKLGSGAVITLSDASILLNPESRDHIMRIMADADTPIQFEVYNFSGTDARAFPQQGKTAPVLALLIPTRGNHSPSETAHLSDLQNWMNAIKVLEAEF